MSDVVDTGRKFEPFAEFDLEATLRPQPRHRPLRPGRKQLSFSSIPKSPATSRNTSGTLPSSSATADDGRLLLDHDCGDQSRTGRQDPQVDAEL
jgi:hypothetical protein